MLVTFLAGGGGESGVGAFPLNIEFGFLGLFLIVGDDQGLIMAIISSRRNDEGTIDLRGSSLSDQFGRPCLFLSLEVELLALLDLIGWERIAILVDNLTGFGGHFHGISVGVQGERSESAIGLALCAVLALEADLEVHRGRLRTAHVGGAEQVFVDFLGVLLFFSGTLTVGKTLVVEAGAQIPDSCLGLGDHGFLGDLSGGYASLLEYGFIADGRVAIGSDPVDLLTNILVGLELVIAREFFPLSGISIIGFVEVYFQLIAVCEPCFATRSSAEEFGEDVLRTICNPITLLSFIDAELGADFLCACSRCYVSCAKK